MSATKKPAPPAARPDRRAPGTTFKTSLRACVAQYKAQRDAKPLPERPVVTAAPA